MRVSKSHQSLILYIVILLIYSITVFFLSSRHEAWIDELNAWRISGNYSIPQIFSLMKTEGHFMPWFMVLFPFAQLRLDPVWLGWISCFLMIISTGLLLWKSKFPLLMKVLIAFSFANIYCFPVISRCYALIPLLLFLIAVIYPKRHDKSIVYGILLALVANTHIYMEGFYMTLLVLFLYECYKEKGNVSSERYRRNIAGGIIGFMGGLIGLLQIVGALFNDTSKEIIGSHQQSPVNLFFSFAESYLGIPYSASHLMWLCMGIALFALLLLIVCSLKGNKGASVIFFVSMGYQFLFALTSYGMNIQRVYLMFYIIIFCIWITNPRKRIAYILASILCLGMSVYGAKYVKYDISGIYSSERMVHDGVSRQSQKTIYAIRSAYIPLESFPSIISNIKVGDIESLCQIDKPNQFSVLFMDYQVDADDLIVSMNGQGFNLKDSVVYGPYPNTVTTNLCYKFFVFEK